MKRAIAVGDGAVLDDAKVPAPPISDIPGYRLVERVAHTARAEVWRAQREIDDAPVAIKVFVAEDAARAAREAEIAAMVEHPHVVRPLEVVVSESGEHDGGGRAAVGLVLPWYDDGSLADLIAVRRRLRWREVLTVLIPLADALAAAHERGFVHGDISPANVLFDPIGRPMLSDFGAARAATEAGAEVYATPSDVAPEIVRGAVPSPAADLFSVGSVALACLTGRSAWFADDLQDVLVQSTAGQWPDLEDNMAPPALRLLVRRLLEPEAEDRGSAAGLAVALRRVGEPEPVELVPLAEVAEPGTLPIVVRAATMVRPDALRPPAKDWLAPAHPWWLRATALLDAVRRTARMVAARSSWRGAAATAGVAVLAWGAMALGWASAASPAAAPAVAAVGGIGSTGESARGGAVSTTATMTVARTSAPIEPQSAAQPFPVVRAGATPDPLASASDPDWLAVMVRLDRARAAAFVARDTSLLGEVYVPGASAWNADVRRIAALLAADARVEQAAHDVLSAELVDLGADGSVVLDVRQVLNSYAIYDASGDVAGTTPPVTESLRRMYLRPTDGGFRIVSVEVRDRAPTEVSAGTS